MYVLWKAGVFIFDYPERLFNAVFFTIIKTFVIEGIRTLKSEAFAVEKEITCHHKWQKSYHL